MSKQLRGPFNTPENHYGTPKMGARPEDDGSSPLFRWLLGQERVLYRSPKKTLVEGLNFRWFNLITGFTPWSGAVDGRNPALSGIYIYTYKTL